MGKDDQDYFVQRAAEEMAAAERAASAEAANAHRELSMRYSLKSILPEMAGEGDDSRPIGQPKRPAQREASVPARRRSATRNRG